LSVLSVVLSRRSLCDGLITRPEESYRMWCVLVCDLETSRMRRLKLIKGCKCRIEEEDLDAAILYSIGWFEECTVVSVVVGLRYVFVSMWLVCLLIVRSR
jgi:hypothetical protein